MQARVDVRAAERDEMAARVKRAKESYEAEALRKQHELHDVEATLARLGEQNHNLTSCVGQVREQISPYISPASRSYLPCISPISPGARADLGARGGHISPISPLYLHYISPISPRSPRQSAAMAEHLYVQ